jgi:hypothetical protein
LGTTLSALFSLGFARDRDDGIAGTRFSWAGAAVLRGGLSRSASVSGGIVGLDHYTIIALNSKLLPARCPEHSSELPSKRVR